MRKRVAKYGLTWYFQLVLQGGPLNWGHLNIFSNCDDAKNIFCLTQIGIERSITGKNIFFKVISFQGLFKVIDISFHICDGSTRNEQFLNVSPRCYFSFFFFSFFSSLDCLPFFLLFQIFFQIFSSGRSAPPRPIEWQRVISSDSTSRRFVISPVFVVPFVRVRRVVNGDSVFFQMTSLTSRLACSFSLFFVLSLSRCQSAVAGFRARELKRNFLGKLRTNWKSIGEGSFLGIVLQL